MSGGVKSFPAIGNLSWETKKIHALKKALKESETEKEIVKKAGSICAFGDDSQERNEIFSLMKEYRHVYAVDKICRVFNVGRSGFYAWLISNSTYRDE